jgi:hypothetical protein
MAGMHPRGGRLPGGFPVAVAGISDRHRTLDSCQPTSGHDVKNSLETRCQDRVLVINSAMKNCYRPFGPVGPLPQNAQAVRHTGPAAGPRPVTPTHRIPGHR